MRRVQQQYIENDLKKKMVFLVGPRQAGKTYLARQIMQNYQEPVYLNYDHIQDRKIIKNQSWLEQTDLLIFDELHKMPDWKNYIKGIFDTKLEHMHILVTGSARLDVYAEVGDSLAGRYFTHHLLPFSLSELKQIEEPLELNHLLQRSGFPEPYLAESLLDAKRWRQQYIDSLVRTDVLDFKSIDDLRAMQTVFELLRNKVGSPISFQSIANDAAISPITVKKYIQILEALYIIFRVTPFSKNIARSLLKEPKIYFFDIGLVNGNEGLKFENHVALSLLKHCYAKRDYTAENYQLNYLRTKEKKEIDFALVNSNNIEKLIEVKLTENTLSKSLQYFSEKYQLPATQVVKNLQREYRENNIPIVKANRFLQELML